MIEWVGNNIYCVEYTEEGLDGTDESTLKANSFVHAMDKFRLRNQHGRKRRKVVNMRMIQEQGKDVNMRRDDYVKDATEIDQMEVDGE